MGRELFQVDAFTDRPFGGNPAAVCFCEEPADEGWMQRVAQEMNLSETAFLVPRRGTSAESGTGGDARPEAVEGGDGYGLRWFTPQAEVPLCGHATLASAHALWESGRLPASREARFHTASGVLIARREGDEIELDFPAIPVTECGPQPELAEALGVTPRRTSRGRDDYLLELESEVAVRAAAPDFAWLRKLPVRGVTITARAENGDLDIVSRFFAPAVGVDEDPVTGAAHCSLAPYWAAILGKTELRAYQASRRGGRLRLRLAGGRVKLLGQAVTVLRGELTV